MSFYPKAVYTSTNVALSIGFFIQMSPYPRLFVQMSPYPKDIYTNIALSQGILYKCYLIQKLFILMSYIHIRPSVSATFSGKSKYFTHSHQYENRRGGDRQSEIEKSQGVPIFERTKWDPSSTFIFLQTNWQSMSVVVISHQLSFLP